MRAASDRGAASSCRASARGCDHPRWGRRRATNRRTSRGSAGSSAGRSRRSGYPSKDSDTHPVRVSWALPWCQMIRTARLLLRTFSLDDVRKVFVMGAEDGMRRWIPDQVYRDEQHAEQVVRALVAYTVRE